MKEIIEQARDMRAFFLLECSGKIPLAINTGKLARVISEQTSIKIIQMLSPDMLELKGMLYREKNGDAVILISDKNTECWKRFTFVKEMSHLFLTKNKTDFNNNAYEQAKCLVDIKNGNHDYFIREASGVIAAIELMIPEEFETKIAHMSQVKNMSLYQISSAFMTPKKFMEYRMNLWNIRINS